MERGSPTVVKSKRLSVPQRAGRARSNSRSSGSRSQQEYEQFAKELDPVAAATVAPVTPVGTPARTKLDPANKLIPPPAVTSRNKYTYIMVLKSLNGTFETKFLVIPLKPDVLKLGRPVVNPGGGSAVGGSAKKDTGSLVRSDNGNFDSRVLSRNHACLSCDAKNGKIYIRDLKSSNGTFVNGVRVESNDVELKIGDVIDLGTDIDSKFEHRKISAYVEEISVIPLINGGFDYNNNSPYSEEGDSSKDKTSGKSVQHLQSNTGHTQPTAQNITSAMSAQRAAFEAAMFGDVNNLDLEDAILGPETEVLSGIFINNAIGTSPELINVIKTLASEIALEKQEYYKLKSMENFMINYTTNLEFVNKLMIEMNDKQLVKLQTTLKQNFLDKHDKLVSDVKDQVTKINKDKDLFKKTYETNASKDKERMNNLEMELEDLKTRLEVEKYKTAQLTKRQHVPPVEVPSLEPERNLPVTDQVKPIDNEDTPKDDTLQSKKPLQNTNITNNNASGKVITGIPNSPTTNEDSNKKGRAYNWRSKRMMTLSAVSIGLIAYLIKYSSS
ncbi:Vps64p KNAG_0A04610 [Huiozyma naganishii CBS 8797]|uniref:FHA domain-containing protein n=1 Tax=Huiozyma naganishii (strain ATCC MYA-139 / BCRC 22969 / CBS 8797 / KCTC 17520 / NBRC 10181 / NCYC 3082 / Yp74L-3) TaxID=1071383 RepID=J7REZ8_HUIN7|nr:hypothetical protein KNAG_0A04610 [Kazachstania naganishii CBS 8797]CCK68133.1 hypothetical protein KNAG_0A04610 [Kazachstania naganishii CBS 8797]